MASLKSNYIRFICIILSSFIIVSCKPGADKLPPSDKDNGGLILPGGFEALVVVDSIGGGSVVALQINQLAKSNAPQTAPAEIKGAPKSTQLSRPNNQPSGNYVGARHIAVNTEWGCLCQTKIPYN
jgi:hypothetical protein